MMMMGRWNGSGERCILMKRGGERDALMDLCVRKQVTCSTGEHPELIHLLSSYTRHHNTKNNVQIYREML